MNKFFENENKLINEISRQQEIESKRNQIAEKIKGFQAAYERAKKLLSDDRIDIDEFKDLYGAETIEKDKKYVTRRQKEFKEINSPRETEMHEYSVIAEAIIHDQIDMNDWLGESATAIKTSLYDDYKYGIDEVVRFKETKTSPTAYLALGVDITFGTELTDKMDKIKDHIKKDDLGKIKYLLTDKYRRELRNVPQVVIGFDMKNLQELKELWMDKKQRALAQHPVKFMVIEQMKLQVDAFARYAQKINQPVIAVAFEEVLKILERINGEELKKYTGEVSDFDFESDRVYRTIKNYCAKFNED